MTRFGCSGLILAALAWGGCGKGFEPASLEVDRSGWDTLRVSIRFSESLAFGRSRPARPLAVGTVVFDAAYDTLYVGGDSVIHVPDARLQDAEPLLLEVCGHFDRRPVCEQRTVFSSPKRVRSRPHVEFPLDETFTRGRYTLDPRSERQRFGSIEWEPTSGSDIPPLTALISVERGGGPPLRLDLARFDGTFDLTRLDGYRDFRFDLRSAFKDSGEARVRFDVVAGYANGESPAGSVVLTVRSRTEEEQLQELSVLVEAAGHQLVDRLFDAERGGRTLVFVNEWEYDAERGRYVIELEVHRRFGVFGRWSEAVGVLTVGDDGQEPVFRLSDGDGEVRGQWAERVVADSLSLDRLPDPRPARAPRVPRTDG